MLTPETLRKASITLVTPWSCINCGVITEALRGVVSSELPNFCNERESALYPDSPFTSTSGRVVEGCALASFGFAAGWSSARAVLPPWPMVLMTAMTAAIAPLPKVPGPGRSAQGRLEEEVGFGVSGVEDIDFGE